MPDGRKLRRQLRLNRRVREANRRVREILFRPPEKPAPELTLEEILSIMRVLLDASNQQKMAEACAILEEENRE